MFKTKKFVLLAMTGIAILILASLAGCTPGATDTPKPPEETSIIIVIPEDPISFNGVATFTGYERFAQEMVMLSLAEADPNGEIYPELAVELPTEENGGVVVDWDEWSMDVTWTLREDVYWEDGEQVTADDVVFTWDALADEETGSWVEGMDYIDSVEALDDFTVVFHYWSIYPGYLLQISMAGGSAIFPEHYCDAEQGYLYWDCNEEPLSNGPYLLEEWVRGDHLTFVRNPNYFEAGKPNIDKVYVQIVPEASVRKTMLEEEAADVDFWAMEITADELEPLGHININTAPATRWLVQLWINQAARGQIDPETGFPTEPHPIFSDVRVRQAMRMAIDVDAIVDGIWPSGTVSSVWTQFFRPPYNICDVPKPVVDPAAAMALLEEAGWTDTDGDGVRECNGCTTGAPEGYEMSAEFLIYAEWGETLELAQQLVAEDLEAIGFDLQLGMVEGGVLWDTYEAGGIEQNADFDFNMWDDGYPGTDPTDYLWVYYHSAAMEPDWGWNVERWYNEDFDAWLDEAYTIDEEYRAEVFCEIAAIMDEEVPTIPLFDAADITIHNSRVTGIQSTINAMVNWNIADWQVVE
jgi:peptide/nickel transport system substrate-binding protein